MANKFKSRIDQLTRERDHWKGIAQTMMSNPKHIEPTAYGDLVAFKVRAWYENNRESWWDRHKPGIMGAGPDRKGTHADEWMLGFLQAVGQAYKDVDKGDY